MTKISSLFGRNPSLHMFFDTILDHWSVCAIDTSVHEYMPLLEELFELQLPRQDEFREAMPGYEDIRKHCELKFFKEAKHDRPYAITIPRRTGERFYDFYPTLRFKYAFERPIENGRQNKETLNLKIETPMPTGIRKGKKLLITNETLLDFTLTCKNGIITARATNILGAVIKNNERPGQIECLVSTLIDGLNQFDIDNHQKMIAPAANNDNPIPLQKFLELGY